MKSIAFTDKQEHVFTRFNTLRRAYEDANGGDRVYNPDFLSVLMDAWEGRSGTPKDMTLLELLEATKKLEGLDEVEIAALDAVIFGHENK